MAQFVLEIPDADVPKVLGAICRRYKRPATVPNPNFNAEAEVNEENPREIENPETPGMFTHRIVREFLQENVIADAVDQAQSAVDAARAAAQVTLINPDL